MVAASVATFITAYLAVVGLMLGSFINLAADRLPRGESIVRPGSHCRTCGRRLNFVDLLPVAGYLIRGGRCATCGTAIGVAAPAVEAVSCALLIAPVLILGLWPGAVAGLVMVAVYGTVVTGRAIRRATETPLG